MNKYQIRGLIIAKLYTKRYCDLNLFIELFNSINPIKLDQFTPFFGNIFENKIKKICYKKSTFIISRKHILILYIKAYLKNLTGERIVEI